jgi:peptidoglycan/xylan/chitin deacetylase (PgdA/CDA1 family)
MNHSIPILMYHQVAPEPVACYPLHSVKPRTFAVQMKLLKILGYNTIDLDQLHEHRKYNANIPRNPIVITFDDGYQDSIDNSVEVLKSYGFTAVYYIPTDYVGKNSSWLMPELGFEFPIIDWAKVTWLDTNGFQIGCHSMSHPHLNEITPKECSKELQESRQILEDLIGHEIKHLAYPYGSYNSKVKTIAENLGYHTACTVETGFSNINNDLLALPRINICAKDSIFDFVSKLYTGQEAFNYLRTKVPARIRKLIRRVL